MVNIVDILVVVFVLWLVFGKHGSESGGVVTVKKKPIMMPRPPAPKPQGVQVKSDDE